MEIRNITIQNFRGINRAKIEGLKKVNLFLGKNNSCKTTVLEGIFLMIGISNPFLPIRINSFRDLHQTEEDDFRFLFHNLNYENIPSLRAEFDEKDSSRTLKILPNKKSPISNGRKAIGKRESLDDLTFDTKSDNTSVNGLVMEFTVKKRHASRQSYKSKVFLEGSSLSVEQPNDYKEEIKGVFITPTAGSPNLDARLERLIVNKQHKEIVEVLKVIDPNIQDISLGTRGMIYLDIGIEKLIPLNLVGDGIRRLLSILVTIADAQNGIVLIDEIENGLHFTALSTLWKVVLESTAKYNVQVFITTHNYETLKYLKECLEREEMIPYREGVKSFTLRKANDNSIKAYDYDFDKFEYSIEQEIELR